MSCTLSACIVVLVLFFKEESLLLSWVGNLHEVDQ